MIDLGQGPQALPAVEIVPGDGGYDYAARYTAGKTEFYVPARLPGDVAAQVARIAIAAHSVLGLRDLSRTDLIVDDDGTAYFLEVNVSPGMTETSTLPMALEASGHAVRQHLRPPARTGRRPRRLAGVPQAACRASGGLRADGRDERAGGGGHRAVPRVAQGDRPRGDGSCGSSQVSAGSTARLAATRPMQAWPSPAATSRCRARLSSVR